MSDGRDIPRWRDDEMRAYLLGTLDAGRQTSLEEQIFDDEEAYDALLDARYDLLDDYARGTLPAVERERVAQRLVGQRGEDALAELLARRQPMPAPGVEPNRLWRRSRLRRPHPRLLRQLAAAAVAMLAIGAAWLALDNNRLRRDLSRAAVIPPDDAASRAVSGVVARIELAPQTIRSQTAQDVTIPPSALVVDIVVPMDEIVPEYRVVLEGRNGALRTERRLTPGPDGALHVRLEAESLSGGSYELLVYAGPGTAAPLVSAIPFRVVPSRLNAP
jgi:hypothetical protein